MALGKRKRRDQLSFPDRAAYVKIDDGNARLQELFQKHFEAHFEPLPYDHAVKEKDLSSDPSTDNSSISDWEGLSDEEEDGPEIIDHDRATAFNVELPSQETRSFMVGVRPSKHVATNLTVLWIECETSFCLGRSVVEPPKEAAV